jgi:hypothetical protein
MNPDFAFTARGVRMSRTARASAPWMFWPIAALWDLIAFVIGLTGRIIGGVLRLVLLILGLVLCMTVILIPIGAPLAIVGLFLVFRSLF